MKLNIYWISLSSEQTVVTGAYFINMQHEQVLGNHCFLQNEGTRENIVFVFWMFTL